MDENEFGPGWLIAAMLGIRWIFRPRRIFKGAAAPSMTPAPLLAVDTAGLDALEHHLERQLRGQRP